MMESGATRWRFGLAAASVILCLAVTSNGANGQSTQGYYGLPIGKLSQLHHGVSGDVYAVDARTLHIRDFTYDGEGPAAYFYAGNSKNPSRTGFKIRDESGSDGVLKRYRRKHITVTLPEGKTLHNIRWFSVYCDEFEVNFGDVRFNKNADYPKPQKINALNGIHGVSSDQIVVVDAQTLLVPGFSYDGEAPDAKFWVGRGPKPSSQGIRVADENGKFEPLRRYDQKTLVLTLPGDLTVFDIGHFGVWCEAFAVDFSHVEIPRNLGVPPSLKMLGVQPQSKLNCEVLYDDLAFEVRWAVAGDSVVLQLVSKLDDNEYMSFGLSGSSDKSEMIGGDVVVAWIDKATLKGNAFDYYLDDKSQCSGSRGSCPDTRIKTNTNSVRLLNAALVNGYSIVTYQRPLAAHDELDRPVYTNTTQPIIWAVGPLNARQEVSYHRIANKRSVFLDFGRAPQWNCPLPEDQSAGSEEKDQGLGASNKPIAAVQKRPTATPAPHPTSGAWAIPPIQCYEPEDGVFYAQMGPTGGKHGYPAITGHVGWGISWYINGLLIPEINVVRGKQYSFVVEGGLDPDTPARFHPFYITDDPVGGYEHKTPQERANVRIFAGATTDKRGSVTPTGTGRLCNWTPDPAQPSADEFASFGAYQRTLTLVCDEGNPGVVTWTPDHNTPDTVYYQCFTHRYLGWKINVLDSCDASPSASEPVASQIVAPRDGNDDDSSEEGDLEERPSIQVETRIRPFTPNLYGMPALVDAQLHAKTPLYILKTVPQNDGINSLKTLPSTAASGLQNAGNGFETIAIDQATLAVLQDAKQRELEMKAHQHQQQQLLQQQQFNSGIFPSQTVTHIPGKTLYDHLKEETTKQEQATEAALAFQSLSTLRPSLDALPNLAPPASSIALDQMKLVTPSFTSFGMTKVPRIPLSRIPGQMMFPGQMMNRPSSFGPRRPIMMSHRPSMYRPSSFVSSISPHGYNMKKKPYYRFPMISSTTLRPVYVPGYTGRPITTLRPIKPYSIAGPTKLHKIPTPDKAVSLSTTITPSPGLTHQSTPFSMPNYHQLLMQQQQALQHLKEQSNLEQLQHFQSQQSNRLQSHPPPFSPPSTPLPQHSLNPHAQSSHFQHVFQAPYASQPVSAAHLGSHGFNPGSVVVEGGFKPIIQRREDVAQKRADVDGIYDDEEEPITGTVVEIMNRSSDVSEEDEESGESTNKPFESQHTENFEPIFVPSPPDRNSLKPGKKSTIGSVAKDSKGDMEMMIVRRRPGLVRRPLYPNMVVPPFKIPSRGNLPQFRNKQQTDDIYEESLENTAEKLEDSSSDELLPEASAVHNVVSFDNMPVPSSGDALGPKAAALVRNTPQFGPFSGELPPLNTDNLHLPQSNEPSSISAQHQVSRKTLLSPVHETKTDSEDSDELVLAASDSKEVYSLKQKAKGEVSPVKVGSKKALLAEVDSGEEFERLATIEDDVAPTEEATSDEGDEDVGRQKRSAESHHEPGHEGYQVHEHHEHDNEQEQENQQEHEHEHQHEDNEKSQQSDGPRTEDVKTNENIQTMIASSSSKWAFSPVPLMMLCFVATYF